MVDNLGDTVTENLNAGTDLVQSAVSYTLGANLENLTLTGVGAINGTGNDLDNILTGNSGINVLTGGAGNDTYVVDNLGDMVTERLNAGTDTVQIAAINYTLGANVENLTLTGVGAINGTGNDLDNILTGNARQQRARRRCGQRHDGGGRGNDTYVVDNLGDTVTENLNAGTDLVQSSVTFTLGANLENLTLTGTDNLNGTGNGLNNTLTGNAGNNILDGGAGADTMTGGLGDDTYVVDNAGRCGDREARMPAPTRCNPRSPIRWGPTSRISRSPARPISTPPATRSTTRSPATRATTSSTAERAATPCRRGAGNDTYVVDNVGDTVTENLERRHGPGAERGVLSRWGPTSRTSRSPGWGRSTARATTSTTSSPATAAHQWLLRRQVGGRATTPTWWTTLGDVVTEELNAGTDTVQILGRATRWGPTSRTSRSPGRGRSTARATTSTTSSRAMRGNNVLDGGRAPTR